MAGTLELDEREIMGRVTHDLQRLEVLYRTLLHYPQVREYAQQGLDRVIVARAQLDGTIEVTAETLRTVEVAARERRPGGQQ